MIPEVLVCHDVFKKALNGGQKELEVIEAVKTGKIKGWISSLTKFSLASEFGEKVLSLLTSFREIPLRPSLIESLKAGEIDVFNVELNSARQFGLKIVITAGKLREYTEFKQYSPAEFIASLESGELKRRERIPLVDLRAQLHTIYNELDEVFTSIITHNTFAASEYVRKFEDEFANYLGVKHVILTCNGTSALMLALLALGVGSGDEVVTVPFTFVATLEAIVFTGATPVLVDIDPATYTMDPSHLRKVISHRTRAIMPVHLYGQPADMDPILEIAEKYGIKVIEDACQSHGALYKGRKTGTIGHVAAFSFYPGKNLGAWGEAGAVATNDDELAAIMRKIRDHGAEKKYFYLRKGLNLRSSNFQGAVLSVKLKYLDQWNERRRELAHLYNELLRDINGVITPYEAPYARHVYHLYVIKAQRRDLLRLHLAKRGIDTGIYYPIPLHLQKAYVDLGYIKGDFPNAENAAAHVLALPMFPELEEEEVERICSAIKEFYS